MIKKKFKSLFTQDEIKQTETAIKVEQSKTEHAQEHIQIEERPVACKKCGAEFTTADVLCYECFQYPSRVVVYCPVCVTPNKINKVLTFDRSRK